MDLTATLAAMQTAFAAIDGTGGYTNNVKSVNGRRTNRLSGGEDVPSVNFFVTTIDEMDPTDRAGNVLTAHIVVQGWVRCEDEQNPSIPLSSLWMDLRKAIKANRTWTSTAMDTDFVSHQMEGGESQAVVTLNIDVRMWDAR